MRKELFNPNQNEKRIYKLRTTTIFLVGMFVLSLLVGAVTATACMNYTNAVFIPDNGALIGVSYNPAESEQDIKDLQSFENWSGKKHSIVVIFQGFSPDEQVPFPRTQVNNLWQNGNTPLLTLEPWGSDDILDVINNGTLDSYFEKYAKDLKNWTQENWTVNGKTGTRKQLFLRFGHEMNLHDEAYPWSNKSPSAYKNAWKRVHNIFEEHGLTSDDVQWVWCVNHVDVPLEGYKAEEYYPGEYVDWVAIDGYNVGKSVPCADWDNGISFDSIFKPMLDRFDSHPNISKKPYAIIEFASTSVVDSKPVKEFNVYTNNNSPTNHYIPSGWMGDWGDITFDENDTTNPHFGIACGNSSIKIIYSANASQGQNWAGIYWQDPENNWGDKEGGYNLSGATNLKFWARGEKGGEKSEFMVGGLGSLKPAASTGVITLTKEWKQYTIELSGKNLSRIIGGFCWATGKADNPHGCTIYLDDIRYESSTGIKNVCVEEGISNNTEKGKWILDAYKSIKKYPKIKMVCYFNIDKGGTKYLTGESDWAVFSTPRDNRNNIDDCSFDADKRICEYSEAVEDDYYIYRFPLYTAPKAEFFNTGEGTYPSIFGIHKGIITPSDSITVNKMYTYPCLGTGGHTESIELYENNTLIANGTWNGYKGNWHNITIHNVTEEAHYVTLYKDHKYNYTIITGSYPQIIHETSFNATGGTITCTQFIDANGKVYTDWIPAIRLF